MAQFELEYDVLDHETGQPIGNERYQYIEASDDDDALNKFYKSASVRHIRWYATRKVEVTTKPEEV